MGGIYQYLVAVALAAGAGLLMYRGTRGRRRRPRALLAAGLSFACACTAIYLATDEEPTPPAGPDEAPRAPAKGCQGRPSIPAARAGDPAAALGTAFGDVSPEGIVRWRPDPARDHGVLDVLADPEAGRPEAVRTRALWSGEIQVDGAPTFAVVTATTAEGGDDASHAAAPALGLLLVGKDGEGACLLAVDAGLTALGSWGEAPVPEEVTVGVGRTGLLLRGSFRGQGEEVELARLITVEDGAPRLTFAGTVGAQVDAGCAAGEVCWAWGATLTFEPGDDPRHHALRLTATGRRPDGAFEDERIYLWDGARWTFPAIGSPGVAAPVLRRLVDRDGACAVREDRGDEVGDAPLPQDVAAALKCADPMTALSPDGRILVLQDGTRLLAYDFAARTLVEVAALPADLAGASSPVFAPDGRRLAVALVTDARRTLLVADVVGGRLRRRLITEAPVRARCDGRCVVEAGVDVAFVGDQTLSYVAADLEEGEALRTIDLAIGESGPAGDAAP